MRNEGAGCATFSGVDLHTRSVPLRAIRADGELLGPLTCTTKCVERVAEWISNLPGPMWMAVEACPCIERFIDRYTPCVDRMDIADPQPMHLQTFGRPWRQRSRSLAKAKQGVKSMLKAAARSPPFAARRLSEDAEDGTSTEHDQRRHLVTNGPSRDERMGGSHGCDAHHGGSGDDSCGGRRSTCDAIGRAARAAR
jgi:hypothetical protein